MKPLLVFIFLPFLSVAQDSELQPDTLVKRCSDRVSRFLDKENALQDYYSITKKGVRIFSSPEARQKDSAELFFPFYGNSEPVSPRVTELLPIRSPSNFKPSAEKPLNGLRIALDPGHIGGSVQMAKMERRIVQLKADGTEKLPADITLIEGNLALQTAQLLKQLLGKAGAEVMLTHSKPGITAFGISFEEWMKTGFRAALDTALKKGDITAAERTGYLTRTGRTQAFRNFFVYEEMKERARKINAFHPDATVIIHYNVDENNTGWIKPTEKDYIMSFVGGSFMKDEMQKPEYRLEFLRLLLTGDMENSIAFCDTITRHLSSKLGVPIARNGNALYLSENCMATGCAGVYCRNLSLTRMVHGRLCYGETLYQDNAAECKLLDPSKTRNIDGILTTDRVKQVADAYYEGILKYFSK